jgi:hypothetical protein
MLHTWTRQYEYHPHVHFIASGGGIDQQGHWQQAHPKFLVPVRALSVIFRARFRDALREQYPELFAQIKATVWKHNNWVVHSKPVGAGQRTLAYLARYVYRVALSERAILRHDSEAITLRYRKSDTNQPRLLRLKPQEFIRRFLQHVLPSGFRKVRYFGLHHSSKRPLLRFLQAAMALHDGLPLPFPPPQQQTRPPTCPNCHTPMHFEGRITLFDRATCFPAATQTRGPP